MSPSDIAQSVHEEVNHLLDEVKVFFSDEHASEAPVHEHGGVPSHSKLAGLLSDFQRLSKRGSPVSPGDIPALWNAVRHTNELDDREFLLEKLVTLMARLPKDSKFNTELQAAFIGILYKDLPHPPSGYTGIPSNQPVAAPTKTNNGVSYAYRTADGTLYNPLTPSLGKARAPYARSVPSTHPIPPSALPDPGLVFDTLHKRDKFEAHPGGLSSFFFALANLIVHSVFDTDTRNPGQNNVSSYLDLSPLYGSSEESVKSVRRADGSGRLWEDCFADSRILDMPPSSGALLVLFCRNHNYAADKILSINENGNLFPLADLKSKGAAAIQSQDEELFQRARLVNTGLFMQCIFGDYVGAILGLVRDNNTWRLNPLLPERDLDHAWSPRGEGNVVSMEFNFMYRWHAALSELDTNWTEQTFNKLFDDKPYDEITVSDFIQTASKYINITTPPTTWPIAGLTRGPDGRFKDEDLANVIVNATEAPASAFKARGTPEVLRIVEILGIMQARRSGACTLNEFRKFMGLKEYKSFEEWNPDRKIWTAAEKLYTHIDNLELHVGLQAEEPKGPMPGAGLCPGYTISRAILGDAVCLTRGDRFMTVDFTPYNLTSWGYNDCQFQDDDGSFGGMVTKLLYRTLPAQYDARSAWARFPFMVPSTMKGDLIKNSPDDVANYNFEKPTPPKAAPVALSAYSDVRGVMGDEKLESAYRGRVVQLVKTSPAHWKLVDDVLSSPPALKKFGEYFAKATQTFLEDKSIDAVKGSTKSIDVVRHVINLVPIYFISTQIASLPLKNDAAPAGELREQELVSIFAEICNFIFLDLDAYEEWGLRERALAAKKRLVTFTKDHLEREAHGVFSSDGIVDWARHWETGEVDESNIFIRALLHKMKDAKLPHDSLDELAEAIFGIVIATAASYASAVTHIVDYYLDVSRKVTTAELVKLCAGDAEDKDVQEQILGCVYNALKHNPPVAAAYYTATAQTEVGAQKVPVAPGQTVVCNLLSALGAAPSGERIDLGTLGLGRSGLFNKAVFDATVPKILRPIFALQNVQRGPGQSGQLTSFQQVQNGIEETLYVNINAKVTPFPASLVIQYGPAGSSPPTTNGTANGHAYTNGRPFTSTRAATPGANAGAAVNGNAAAANGRASPPPSAPSTPHSGSLQRAIRRYAPNARSLSGIQHFFKHNSGE
jgi:prostaglandin-endoperoxide synthase 2